LRKVGIGLNLRLVTPETRFALIMERKFDLVSLGWTGLVFPNPETSYSSRLADVNNTNNVDGIKSARIDELLDIYDREFDPQKRIGCRDRWDRRQLLRVHSPVGEPVPGYRVLEQVRAP
jgi:ABC-type oligopeptide transport system substrate-binding subunit